MTRWRDVGRHLADPEHLARWLTLAVAALAAAGFAHAVGVAVHPAWGWAFLFLAAGVPCAWLMSRWADGKENERARAEEAARRAGERGRGDLDDVVRGPHAVRPPRPAEDDEDGGGVPRPTWGRPN